VPTADDLPQGEWDDAWWEDDRDLSPRGLGDRPLWFRVAVWCTLAGLLAFVLIELRYFFF
jgi:hypothetical protein